MTEFPLFSPGERITTVLSLDDIGIEFGGRWLLRHTGYQFKPGHKTALLGRNGSGKSTLLKMIAGELSPTEGKIHRSKSLSIGFFNQDLLSWETDRSIFEVIREAFLPLLRIRDQIDALHHKGEAGEATPEDWDQLSHLEDRFQAQGGLQMDATAHNVLSGLGFPGEDHDSSFYTYSGGWRMRVLLGKMLLEKPDVLLLDEPTNHLDLPSIVWLEKQLQNFKGICILVSHDRTFIDRIATEVVEILHERLHTYTGNYSYYLKEKALRQEQHERAYDNQQKYIEEQERFINRFRSKATKARQVQSKIKLLEKVERILPPESEGKVMKMRFSQKEPSGKEVMAILRIRKAFGDNLVIEDATGEIMRGDKIGLIGPNGMGKSTLLRILANTESFEGERKLGHKVKPSFFAQHQLEALNLGNQVLEEMDQSVSGKTELELRTILGCFMFSGEDVEKPIRVLSGGEKSRVALAKTLLSYANFLLLDEPTNHLDIQSIQILIEALQSYEGSYVVVSHDRHFLSQVCNKIWYFEDRYLKVYPGDYAEYEYKQQLLEREQDKPGGQAKSKASDSISKTKNDGLGFRELKRANNRIRKLERHQEAIEEEITQLEQLQAALSEQMGSPEIARDFDQLSELQKAYDERQNRLDAETEHWEKILLEIEELKLKTES